MRLVDALDGAGSSNLQFLQGRIEGLADVARLAGENMLRAAVRIRLGPTDRKKLIAGIHAQAKTLQLDHETRREMQRQLVGVESTKDMSLGQLSTVWHRLTQLAQDAGLSTQHSRLSTRRKRPGRDERLPDEVVTQEQLDAIALLFSEIEVHPGVVMMGLCRRACGKSWCQTRSDGVKVIEMLKQMKARNWRPTKGTLT